MLSESVVKFIVNETKKSCDPSIDRDGYIIELFNKGLDAIGFSLDEFDTPRRFFEEIDIALQNAKDGAKNNDHVTICDIYNIDYLRHAILQGRLDSRFYLVGIDLNDEYKEKLVDFSAILTEGLVSVKTSFAGSLINEDDLDLMLTGKTVNQVRQVHENYPFDPVAWFQETDCVHEFVKMRELSGSECIIYWNEKHPFPETSVNSIESVVPFSVSDLTKAFQVECDEATYWLFVFESSDQELIEMSYCCDEEERLNAVSNWEVYVNKSRSPYDYIMRQYIPVDIEELGNLSRIQRGTTLSRKNLDIEQATIIRYDNSTGIVATLAKHSSGDRLTVRPLGKSAYIDQSCIDKDGTVSSIMIPSIPEKQEKYTVFPEDGLVILVSRNGELVVPFRAMVPTLVSSNIFIIFPYQEIISSSYLICALLSDYSRLSLRLLAKNNKSVSFLSKKELTCFPVMMLPEKYREMVVQRDRAIQNKIRGLRNSISRLCSLDRFDPTLDAEDTFRRLEIK